MSTNSSKSQRSGARHSAPRRPIKVTPRRKERVDPHMIALVYFLIASRIVREAKETEAPAGRSDGEAGDPLEALDLFRRNPAAVDVLVSDVMMPHMTGSALARQLLSERPELRVVLISGYASDVLEREPPPDDAVSSRSRLPPTR